MGERRRVAVMAEAERLDARQRAALRGIERFVAERAGAWRVAMDPFAAAGSPFHYDGILALANADAAAREPPEGTPVVAVSHASWHRRTLSRVLPNLRSAGRVAAEHLLGCGFSRFGFLGYCPDLETRLLREGFARKLRRAGLGQATLLFNRHGLGRASGWSKLTAAFARWLETDAVPPVGVFAGSLTVARSLADVCARQGLGVPEDVAILCPDGEAQLVGFPPPALSTLDLGYEPCGHRAAELLDELMTTGSTEPHRVMLPPGAVTARRSTDVVTWHDAVVQRGCRYIAEHCGERGLRVADVAAGVGVSLRELQRRFRARHSLSVGAEIQYARLRRARRLLLGTALSVEEVARRSGLSSGRRLAKLLREAEGMSPTELRRVRPPAPKAGEPDIERAKHLMATTDRPLDTIAYDCGYRRHRYLIDAFKSEEGMTPRAWRKRHRQRPPPAERGPFTMTFIGPDGEVEEQRTYGPNGTETVSGGDDEA